MNKFSIAIALGVGLTLSMVAPVTARASAIQTLDAPEMSAATFNGLFAPIAGAPAMSSSYQYLGAPTTGSIGSQVFKGVAGTAADGYYAYAYQVGINKVATAGGEPVHTDSLSFQFNATPSGADFLKSGRPTVAYVVKDGPIGGLTLPLAAPGGTIMAPTHLSWQSGLTTGAIRAQYVDPTTQTPPLDAGANSATFLILSKQPFSQQFVNLQSSLPTTGLAPSVYAATGGPISQIPAPEPATLLAWFGMAGATLVVRRVRKGRAAA